MPLFSIILPVKNGGAYAKQCVASILSQTITDFNLIVLDSCSNDGTVEWLRSLNDNRIDIHESTVPLTIEKNWERIKGIKKNEFMTMIGHDDILEHNYLEIMSALIHQHPDASLYQAHFQYIDADGKIIRKCLPMQEVQYSHEFLASFMCRTIDSTGTGYLMRSKDYDNAGGIDPLYKNLIFADYALWTDLSGITYKATAPALAFKYRIHDSLSKITNGEDYAIAFERLIYHLDKASANKDIKNVIITFGKGMLMYNCEAISHRILKTPKAQRNITVEEFINKCVRYAKILIPTQTFEPLLKFRIRIAKILDNNSVTRKAFFIYKKVAR